MSKKTFGFIGCGNMGGALAAAACKSGVGRVLLANRTRAKAEALAAQLEEQGAAVAVAENPGVAEEADYIFLGVKPQMMADMLESIAPVLAARDRDGRRFVLVTMAAGRLPGDPHYAQHPLRHRQGHDPLRRPRRDRGGKDGLL